MMVVRSQTGRSGGGLTAFTEPQNKLERTQTSGNGRVNKQIVVCLHNGIIVSHKTEQNHTTTWSILRITVLNKVRQTQTPFM